MAKPSKKDLFYGITTSYVPTSSVSTYNGWFNPKTNSIGGSNIIPSGIQCYWGTGISAEHYVNLTISTRGGRSFTSFIKDTSTENANYHKLLFNFNDPNISGGGTYFGFDITGLSSGKYTVSFSVETNSLYNITMVKENSTSALATVTTWTDCHSPIGVLGDLNEFTYSDISPSNLSQKALIYLAGTGTDSDSAVTEVCKVNFPNIGWKTGKLSIPLVSNHQTYSSNQAVQYADWSSAYEFNYDIGSEYKWMMRYDTSNDNIVYPPSWPNHAFLSERLQDFANSTISNSRNFAYGVYKNVIESSKTGAIASNAFKHISGDSDNCENLTKVAIPDSVEIIKERAFENCTSLTDVVYLEQSGLHTSEGNKFHNGLNTIKSYAFNNCNSLGNINLNQVNVIETCAFQNCTSLTSITIPHTTRSLGESVFCGCSNVVTVTLAKDSNNRISLNSLPTRGFYNTKVNNINKTRDRNYILEGIKSIGNYCFAADSSYNGVTNITIPSTATYVGKEIFKNNSSLTTVYWNPVKLNSDYTNAEVTPFYINNGTITQFTFGDYVENIPSYLCYTFNSSFTNSLGQEYFPDSLKIIGNKAFKSTQKEDSTSYTFKFSKFNTQNHKQINLKEIKSYAFEGANLSEIEIPYNVQTIGVGAFSQIISSAANPCLMKWKAKDVNLEKEYLENTYVSSSIPEYGYEYRSGYFNTNFKQAHLDVQFLEGTKVIPYNFGGRYPYGGNNIGADIRSVTISDGVEKISDYAFYAQNNMPGSNIYQSFDQITIPGSITYLGKSSFLGCISLKKLNINNGITDIQSGAFLGMYEKFKDSCGRDYSYFPELQNIIVPSSVNIIRERAFAYNDYIKPIIPKQGGGCNISGYDIRTMNISIGCGIQKIEREAFATANGHYNSNLGSSDRIPCLIKIYAIEPPEATEDIFAGLRLPIYFGPDYIHSSMVYVNNISRAWYADSFRPLHEAAPYYLKYTPSIDNNTYGLCYYLQEDALENKQAIVTFPSHNITYFTNYNDVFNEEHSTEYINYLQQHLGIYSPYKTYDAAVNDYRNYDFSKSSYYDDYCVYTARLYFADPININGELVYSASVDNNEALSSSIKTATSITVPYTTVSNGVSYNVTEIGEEAFRNCTNLQTIYLPTTVTNIGPKAFYGCTNLTKIGFKDSNGNEVDSDYSDLRHIDRFAFSGCTSLTTIGTTNGTIKIPRKVTSIGEYCFRNCTSMVNVQFGDKICNIPASALVGCTSISDITINNENEYYVTGATGSKNALYKRSGGYKKLIKVVGNPTQFYVPNDVYSVGNEAFQGCSNLTLITFGENVNELDFYESGQSGALFQGCSSLNTIIWNSKNYSGGSLWNLFFSNKSKNYTFKPRQDVTEQIPIFSNYDFRGNVISMEFGVNVQSIPISMFKDRSGLQTILCKATTPPVVNQDAFKAVTKSIYVAVPSGCLNAYKQADGWKSFTNIVEDPNL